MRTAEIYPIQRLPRRFSIFDYQVPEAMKIDRGFFVRIPFRHQEILGVVKKVQEKFSPRQNLKTIVATEKIRPLQETELQLFEWLADDLAQSVPAVLNAAIPLPNKHEIISPKISPRILKIQTREVSAIQRARQIIEERRRVFLTAIDLSRMTALVVAYLHLHPQDRVAILVPGINEAESLAPYFFNFGLSLLSGRQTFGQRFKAWDDFRNRRTKILIGTHLAALLLPDSLDALFVFRSGHESHKQWDRNPRYDTRSIAEKFQALNNCRLYFLDVAPRIDDLVSFTSEQIYIDHPEPRPFFIDPTNERPMSPHPIISQTLSQAIEQCLAKNRKILCFYNRKGRAYSLGCNDCGQSFPCPKCGGIFTVYETSIKCHHCGAVEPLPLTCPNCHGPNLKERGFGNRTIKQALEKIFPKTKVAIIDKTLQEDESQSQIILATTYYLETYKKPFVNQNFGLIVDLDADLPLLAPGFRAFENALKQMETLRGLALREQAIFLVQTKSRNLFEAYYENPTACLLNELTLRRSYATPPFVRWMTLKIRDPEERRAELELRAIIDNLQAIAGLTFFPIKYEKSSSCSVAFSVQPTTVPLVLEKLSELPDWVVIDTDAIS